MIFRFSVTTTARFFTAVRCLVDGRPGAALGFILRYAAFLVAFLDVVGLSFLLVGVFRFITAWHCDTLPRETPPINAESVPDWSSGHRYPVPGTRAVPKITPFDPAKT